MTKRAIRPDKIVAPVPHSIILHREPLINALTEAVLAAAPDQQSTYKLALLCAPAGYGKTTLLADVIQRTSLPCCWCFLDKEDAAPTSFLQVLLASVRQCFPFLTPHVDRLAQESGLADDEDGSVSLAHWEKLIDELLTLLKTEIPQRFAFALCNYQEVNKCPSISSLLNYLLAVLPAQGVVIVESRSIPHLELARLIARRQFFGLGDQQLRFTAQEIHDLAHLQGHPTFTKQAAEQVEHSFAGWIAGILLGSSLGRSSIPTRSSPRAANETALFRQASSNQLAAYLDNEVFAEEQETYVFLQETSVFAQLTPAHCNALLGREDAEQLLLYAYQQGLFVTPAETSDQQTSVFTCHPALREVFHAELRSQSPARYLALERRAADLSLAHQEYEQALHHAFMAEEHGLATEIVLDIAPLYLERKQVADVEPWLRLLPEEKIAQTPQLLLIQANIHWLNGEYQQMAPLLDTAATLLQAIPEGDKSASTSSARADLALTRANLLFSQGEFQQVEVLCRQALTLLSADQHYLRIKAHQCLGLCLIAGTGQISSGIVQLQQALHLSNSQKEREQAAVLHRQLGSAYSWVGNYILAEYHQKRAQLLWEQLGNPRGIINCLTSMGHLKRRQGFMQEAEDLLKTALDMACNTHHFESGEAYALLGFGELFCDTGQYAQALIYLEDSLKLGTKLSDVYLMNCAFCVLATVYMLLADTRTAQFFLDQVVIKEQKTQSFEGVFHCLTQGSLLLEQRSDEQAREVLENAVALARKADIQFFLLSALLRLAVCHFRLGRIQEAYLLGAQALELNRQGNHDHRLQMEIEHYPELEKLVGQPIHENLHPESLPQELSPAAVENGPLLQVLSASQTTPHLRIRALGEPAVFVDDVPVTHWRMARAMELYFFLLQSPRPVRKDQILLALWPDSDAERIEQTIRSTIYYLRLAIGKDRLISSSGLYSLNLALYGQHVWYDVALFDQYYEEARQSLEKADDERAVGAFTEMIELYQGDYLQPFYGDWCIARRDQIRQAYMDARQQLAQLAWRGERFEESLQHWQHLLALDACFEKAHAGIMRYYLRTGQRELALRQYQRCCLQLQEELQTAPGPSLQKLYQRAQAMSQGRPLV